MEIIKGSILELISKSVFIKLSLQKIGQLCQLKIFNIQSNDLKGNIPIEFGNITVFNNNFLNGEVPSEMVFLSKLTHLTFSGHIMRGAFLVS